VQLHTSASNHSVTGHYSFVAVDGRPLRETKRQQNSRVHHGSVYAIHISQNFSLLNKVNVFAGDLCSKTENFMYVRCSATAISNNDATSRTLKRQTVVMPSEVMKWRSCFCDDVKSDANLSN
jgi:hypothetical protein